MVALVMDERQCLECVAALKAGVLRSVYELGVSVVKFYPSQVTAKRPASRAAEMDGNLDSIGANCPLQGANFDKAEDPHRRRYGREP